VKRGNTALKRVVSVASVAAMAIAGAVLAAPAASALIGANDFVRATPAANASNVDATGAAVSTSNAARVYGLGATLAATGSAIALQGSAAIGNGIQIAVPGTSVGSDIAVALPTGVTFVGTPIVTVDPVAVDYDSLAARSAGFSGTNADAAHVPGNNLNSTDFTIDTSTLPSTLTFKLNATTHAGDAYLVTIDPVKVKVDPATATAGPVTAAVTIGATAVGVTTLGFVPSYTVSAPSDAALEYVPSEKQDLPAITLAEGVVGSFSAASYTLSVTGASFETGTAAEAAVKFTGTNGVTGTLTSLSSTDLVFTVGGAAGTLQSLDVTGLTVTGVTAGTDVKVSLSNAAGVATTAVPAANYSDDVATATASAFSFVPSLAVPSVTIGSAAPRIAGSDRYATAADIADRFAAGSPVNAVVLANGLNAKDGVDALSANFLASAVGAPILLTDSSDSLPSATRGALVSLFKDATGVTVSGKQVVTIYVMGKTDSVADAAANEAQFIAKAAVNSSVDSVEIVRVAGDDRYETSAAVVGQGNVTIGSYKIKAGQQYLKTAILASGAVNADALAAGSLSASANVPVLLTTAGDALPTTVADAIKAEGIKQVVILGSTDRVSDAVVGSLADLGVTSTYRIAGTDRYATAADLYSFATQQPTTDKLGLGLTLQSVAYLANGTAGFADALAVGPLAGQTSGSPAAILTVPTATLPDSTSKFLKAQSTNADPAGQIAGIVTIGQTDRVSAGVVQGAEDALK